MARIPRLIHPSKEPATVPPPLEGVWAPEDTRLDHPDLFPLPTGHAPEDVAIDHNGRLVAGGDDGKLWRWPADAEPGDPPHLLAETHGRPLGIELDPTNDTLVVCDAYKGLLRVSEHGQITELAHEAAGTPILFCNNASIARDGTVYFTDTSNRFPLSHWRRDLIEHQPNGRLLRYDPATNTTDVVATGLYFPNGVALLPDESAILLAETSTHRLLRVPLNGGEPTVLTDLPAYPDNVSAMGDGTYWVALPSPRLPIAERLLPHPGVRRVAALLPEAAQPHPKRYSLAALVDSDGRVLRVLHGPGGAYTMVTGVRQHGDVLWLGSLVEPAVGRVRL